VEHLAAGPPAQCILRAIEPSAGRPVPPMPAVKNPLKAIRRPLPARMAVDRNSKGIYADDPVVAGMLHGRAQRSRSSARAACCGWTWTKASGNAGSGRGCSPPTTFPPPGPRPVTRD